MIEKNFITSGRNTIIHKNRKFDLLIVNGENPVVIISNRGIGEYKGEIPRKRSEAKKVYQEVIDISSSECFGEENQCVITPNCQLKNIFAEAQENFFKTLDNYTLEDLIKGQNKVGLTQLLTLATK